MERDNRQLWRLLLFRCFFLFVLFFILTCSFTYRLLPDTGSLLGPVSEKLNNWTGVHIFRLQRPFTSRILSDSTGMYLLAFNVLMLAIAGTAAWSLLSRPRRQLRLEVFLYTVIAYFLALHMFLYGFSKVFKWQFYQPDPNILFTTIGNTHKDLLYWTTMGASRFYVMFMGWVEVAAGALLLWRRTRPLGGLLVAGIMLNVVMVNFGFDISVKCFSLFLFVLACSLSMPALRMCWQYFLQGRVVAPPRVPVLNVPHRLKTGLKALVIILILAESLWAYVQSGNYNDDLSERPPLHGAWEVVSFVRNGDSLDRCSFPWKRFFVHRLGYFIIEQQAGNMKDYELKTDTLQHQLRLHDYENGKRAVISYRQKGMYIDLQMNTGSDTVRLQGRKIRLDSLPLMKKGFHWTIDAD